MCPTMRSTRGVCSVYCFVSNYEFERAYKMSCNVFKTLIGLYSVLQLYINGGSPLSYAVIMFTCIAMCDV